ncbi:ATP-binding cassette domain-containing protein [Ruminococcus sp. 5_1_39BFAA]|uniref:ATP-binding cassette domain-containing protein n=1 Tax=Ruminococcus sp. 5_1_39BFAA TaxID=457412 RepID=UPI003565FBAC
MEYKLPKLSIFNEKSGNEEKILSRNIFLRVRGAEKICIVGKNGVGKTTLIKKIAEELLERDDIRAEYMPQDYEEP